MAAFTVGFSVHNAIPAKHGEDSSFEILDSGVLVTHDPDKDSYISPNTWAWVEIDTPKDEEERNPGSVYHAQQR